jgi:quercetin 2,3-dioxygenase
VEFRSLRVLNDDRIAAGQGFGMHPHRDMEIITYMVSGALEHKDSLGTGSVIRPGEVQVMSAGTGIRHSEYNHSKKDPVHFLQIWVLPDRQGLAPRYDQKAFSPSEKCGRLRLVGSPDGRDGSIVIHQDVELYDALLADGDAVTRDLKTGRKNWVQVVRGAVDVNGKAASAGDGIALENEDKLSITARADDSEVLVFDLP